MRRRSLLLLLAAAPAKAQVPALLPAEQALPLLREGGLNIYMRHATTDRSQVDTGRLGDRGGQRNLSPAGEAMARDLGAAMRRLGVPPAEVLTSEVFRAQDTARLAFGTARIHPALIADDYTRRDARQDAAEISALLGERIRGGNRLMVGHIVPLGMILGRSLAQAEFPEGSLALFRPGDAGWRFLGIVPAEVLIAAAR
ncbi:histidine phosphatase family protein [Roseomonas sp. SSH11]|uniref:Histidine phosphatase family protein n=1 Tax=Pararoseomonas baculiformis TaxID=2820812 RepID=A0ABS4AID0_9PROT|nr:histidine phosphatase family protein [Pararoseomonas baculiformis]MBP0446788.1 histidine phosphatase family protein [Pararoseomonas baculiformis]